MILFFSSLLTVNLTSLTSLPFRLYSQYAISVDEFVPRLELYTRYLSHCSQLGYGTLATQAEFDNLIKLVPLSDGLLS